MTSAVTRPGLLRPQLATMLMIGTVVVSALIAIAWFSGNGWISTIFAQLDLMQQHPPAWAMTPMMVGHYFLFWTAALMVLVWVVMAVSPTPTHWSRIVVVLILGILTVRYLMWRTLSTLNLSNPLDGVFSLGLFALELMIFTVAHSSNCFCCCGLPIEAKPPTSWLRWYRPGTMLPRWM
jgi:cellulose synthase (UDP-forming)